jgi:hypothetical protein
VRESYGHEDIPKGSHFRHRRSSSWKKKVGSWMKAIFTTCTYVTRIAYEDRLENQEAHKEARERAGLPPLPLV